MGTLQAADVADASSIADIHTSARREAMPYLPTLHSDEETLHWVTEIVLPHQVVWVAVEGESVAGYMAMDGAELNDLYVHPDMQGGGIGTALLDKAKELSPGHLGLWTFQRNARARRFYERRGFRVVEFTDGRDNEEREPDVRYEWSR